MIESDYTKYRGKCKEMALEEIEKDPSLILVRGYYLCPMWGKQQHWWCVKEDGTIVDPSVKQFPTAGEFAEYVPFNGMVTCEECGKELPEEDAIFQGRYALCSDQCCMKLVGLGDYCAR